MADLWEVINEAPVEAWGSTYGDDRRGELLPGDVIDVLEAYPNATDPTWLRFEVTEGGDAIEPGNYNELWVRRDEVSLARPEADTPEPEPEEGITPSQLGEAMFTIARWFRDVFGG